MEGCGDCELPGLHRAAALGNFVMPDAGIPQFALAIGISRSFEISMSRLPSGIVLQSKIGTAECPECRAADSDPQSAGFCQTCGAVFREPLRKRLQRAQWAVAAGLLLALLGSLLALVMTQRGWTLWVGLFLSLLAAAALGFGIYSLRRLSNSLLGALSKRPASEPLRMLGTTDKLQGGLLAFFGFLILGCVWVLMLVGPDQEALRQEAEAVFGPRLEEFAQLVPAYAVSDRSKYGEPRRIGKVLVLDVKVVNSEITAPEISAAHLQLPPQIRAQSPAEVETVARVEYEEIDGGVFSARAMTLIDVVNKAALNRLQARNQPTAIEAPIYNQQFVDQIAQHLKELPAGGARRIVERSELEAPIPAPQADDPKTGADSEKSPAEPKPEKRIGGKKPDDQDKRSGSSRR
jgi:hypothetical protein